MSTKKGALQLRDELSYSIANPDIHYSGLPNTYRHYHEQQLLPILEYMVEKDFSMMLPIDSEKGGINAILVCNSRHSKIAFTAQEIELLNNLTPGLGSSIKHEKAKHVILNQLKQEHKRGVALSKSIAHEMRNPLNAIALISDEIKSKVSLGADRQDITQSINNISNVVSEANNIINILLHNVKNKDIGNSKFSLLSIATEAQKAIDIYPFQGKEKNKVDLIIENDFKFIGNATLFHYVLFNLLKNAIYYFSNKPQARITIKIISNDKEKSLYFTDTGIGIPHHKIDSLFDDFTTSGKENGTGLGLAFCRKAMLAFNGKISCTSHLDEFTQFKLEFPLEIKETILSTSKSTLPPYDTSLDLHKPINILIIEDEIMIRKTLNVQLKNIDNLDVHFAVDGIDALEQVKLVRPLIIFTDLNLPKLSGKALVQQLKSIMPNTIILE